MLKYFDGCKSKALFDIVTGDEKLIYNFDPETKQQSTLWCTPTTSAPKKVLIDRSVGKQMVACFFRKRAFLDIIKLEAQKTVNSEWYTTKCV